MIDYEMKKAREKFKQAIELYKELGDKESSGYIIERIGTLPIDLLIIIIFLIESYLNDKNLERGYQNG